MSLGRLGQNAGAERRALVFLCAGLGGASAGISSLLIFEKAKGNHTKLCFCERNPPQQKKHIRLKTCSFLLGACDVGLGTLTA